MSSVQIIEDAAGITLREVIPRVINVAQPAAGVDFTVAVQSGSLWFVEAMVATFVASAAVANRMPVVTLTDGSTAFGRIPTAVAVTASQTAKISYLRGYGDKNAVSISAALLQGFPSIPLLGGFQIQMITQNLDVADQWSAIALYVVEVEERSFSVELEADYNAIRGNRTNAFPQIPLGS